MSAAYIKREARTRLAAGKVCRSGDAWSFPAALATWPTYALACEARRAWITMQMAANREKRLVAAARALVHEYYHRDGHIMNAMDALGVVLTEYGV